MRLDALARTFAQLETTSGRTAAIRLLAALFRKASDKERAPIVYLLQGRLRPAYEGVQLGVGERVLVRVLARVSGESGAGIARRFRRLGDLGLVAEATRGRVSGQHLTVLGTYLALLAVARVSGAGSVERKLKLLVGVLRRATPLEARYLVRIAQGRLRLGVGDVSILEATAASALGDARKRAIVEAAYNVRSDLGGVVRLAFRRGARGLARLAPKPGVPVRPARAQRLPSAEAIVRKLGTVLVEPKYDGFRLQLHRNGDRVWAFSRRLDDVSGMFPELTAAAKRQIKARRVIIDGEAIGYDPKTGRFLPFQVTMTRKRRHGIAEAVRQHPLHLCAFDLLYADGKNYMPRPQDERHRRLAAVVRAGRGPVLVTEELRTDRPDEVQRCFEDMLARGLEGIVAKNPDAPYAAGARKYDWIKLKRAYQQKLRDTFDLVLVGYLVGRGKRARLGIGSLLAAVYDPVHDRFRTVAKIGSGADDRTWIKLRKLLDARATPAKPKRVDATITPDVWVEPHYVVEVLADEITRSPRHTCGATRAGTGYALRFPRILGGVRSDKGPEDATTEREVVAMFKMQRAVGATATRRGRASRRARR